MDFTSPLGDDDSFHLMVAGDSFLTNVDIAPTENESSTHHLVADSSVIFPTFVDSTTPVMLDSIILLISQLTKTVYELAKTVDQLATKVDQLCKSISQSNQKIDNNALVHSIICSSRAATT